MRVLIFISFFFLALSGNAQIAFYKQFSNNGYDFGQGVAQLEDSSYLVTGASSSFTGYQTQAFLLKTDSMGVYQWSRHYGGSESDWGRRVLYESGYGIYVAGFTNSMGNGAYDYYLFKTDLNGDLEWERTYGGTGWDKVHDAALLRDTGVIMVGENSSNPTDNRNIYLVRTDKNGDTLWTKTIGGAGDDWATSVKIHRDSMLVVAGSIYVEDSSLTKGLLAYIHDTSGDIMWMDTISVVGNVNLNDFVIVNDTLDAIGKHWLDDNDFLDIFYLKYEILSPGILNTINGDNSYQGDFIGRGITNYGDNSKRYLIYNIVANFTFPGGEDLHIGRYSKYFGWLGQVVQVARDGQDDPGQIIPTSDGGAVVTGYLTSGGLGGASAFLLKVGPNETYPTVTDVTTVYDLVTLEEVFSLDEFTRIYPNPAQNQFTVETDMEAPVLYKMCDFSGKLIASGTFLAKTSIDVSDLKDGAYMIELSTEHGAKGVYKLMVHR